MRRNNFSLSDLSNLVTNSSAYQSIATDLAPLTPFADSLKKALSQAGIQVPDSLPEIAQAYQQYIVAPSGGIKSGATTDNILSYIKTQMDALAAGKSLSPSDQTVAQKGMSVLDQLESELLNGTLFQKPLFWVVVILVGVGLYFAFKK